MRPSAPSHGLLALFVCSWLVSSRVHAETVSQHVHVQKTSTREMRWAAPLQSGGGHRDHDSAQQVDLDLLLNLYSTPKPEPWDSVDKSLTTTNKSAPSDEVAADGTTAVTAAAATATTVTGVAVGTRSQRPTTSTASRRTTTGFSRAFGGLAVASSISRASAARYKASTARHNHARRLGPGDPDPTPTPSLAPSNQPNPFPTTLPTSETQISAAQSQYTGTLPTEIGLLTAVTMFSITRNSFTGALPSQIGGMTAIASRFMIYSNTFTGSLPTQVGRFSQLEQNFYTYDNSFSGSVPTQLGTVGSVSRFQIYSNRHCGEVPTQVSALSAGASTWQVTTSNSIGTFCDWPQEIYDRFSESGAMDTSSISHASSQITGTIPTEFGLLTETTELILYDNQLTGPIPTQIGFMTAMVSEMQLYSNSLASNLPTQLGEMTALTSNFEIFTTFVNGSLPTQYGRLSNMRRGFELDDNRISGPIPTQLGSLTAVTMSFYLRSNKLCDDVPTELQALSASVSNWYVTDGNDLGTTCCEMGVSWISCSSAPTITPLPTSYPTTSSPTNMPTPSCTAGYYLDLTSNACVQCEAGTANDQTDTAYRTSCQDCDAGYYAATAGLSTCSACAVGTYAADAASTACTDCAAGTYAESTASTSCDDCQAGSYASAAGSSSCDDCGWGTYAADAASSSCTDCAAGTYVNYGAATACTDCPAGSIAAQTGSSSCDDCAAGTYAADAASTACTDCAAGTYAESTASTACTDCQAGSYASAAGSSSCDDCGYGTYAADAASVSCTDCAAGTYVDYQAATACIDCSAGSIAAQTGSSSCDDCAAGTYAADDASTACDDCAAGTYTANAGSASCDDCNAGRISGAAATACTDCEAGKIAAADGSTACTGCAEGTYAADAGSAECLPCNSNDVVTNGVITRKAGTGNFPACGGGGWCSASEGICFCTKDGENSAQTGYSPYGTKAGEAGTCEIIMDADTAFRGGVFMFYILVACFFPCLCFPWVYRAEDRLQIAVVDPYLSSYQEVYHERVTLVEEAERKEKAKQGVVKKTFKQKVLSCLKCEWCCKKKKDSEKDVEMKTFNKLETGETSKSGSSKTHTGLTTAQLKRMHIDAHPIQTMKSSTTNASALGVKNRPRRFYSVVFTLTLHDMSAEAFTKEQQEALCSAIVESVNEEADSLEVDLALEPVQVDISSFTAGSVVVDMVIIGLEDGAEAKAVVTLITHASNRGALLPNAFGPNEAMDVKTKSGPVPQRGMLHHGDEYIKNQLDTDAALMVQMGHVNNDGSHTSVAGAGTSGDVDIQELEETVQDHVTDAGRRPSQTGNVDADGNHQDLGGGGGGGDEEMDFGGGGGGGGGDDDGSAGGMADDMLDKLGIDTEAYEAQLQEYANQLSGFMDVLPSLIISMLELIGIFIVELAGEVFRVLSNVFLVMTSLSSYGALTEGFEDMMERLNDSFKISLGWLSPNLEWIADLWDNVWRLFRFAIDLTAIFKVFPEGISVNCSGSQMPGKMIVNISILIFIAFLIETKGYALVRITAASVSKMYKGRILIKLLVTIFVVGGEGCFKLLIQLAASTVDLTLQWYDHTCWDIGLENADDWLGMNGEKKTSWYYTHNYTAKYYAKYNTTIASNLTFDAGETLGGFRDGDRYVAYATWIIYVLSVVPCVHILIKAMVPGLPHGCEFPDIISEVDCPEPLKHRFFFGGYGSGKLTDFEFWVMKCYLCVPLSHIKMTKRETSYAAKMAFAVWWLLTCLPVSLFLGIEIILRVTWFGILCLFCQAGGGSAEPRPSVAWTQPPGNGGAPSEGEGDQYPSDKAEGETRAAAVPTDAATQVIQVKSTNVVFEADLTGDGDLADDDDGVERGSFFKNMSRETRHNDVPTFIEILYLCGREPCSTLYKYAWALLWKCTNYIKLTIGYWDSTLIEAMEIKEIADRFDEDPLDETDRDGDTLRIMGVSHSLLWQLIPMGLPFAKLGEATNDGTTFIDPDGGLSGYDPFYPPWMRKRMGEGQRCAGLPGKRQDRDFLPSVGHARVYLWVWSMLKYCIMMALSINPGPILFGIFAIFAFPIKLFESLSIWIHLLEDTPDWLLWIEFGNNPVAKCLLSIGSAIGKACCLFMRTAGEEVGDAARQAANAAGDVADYVGDAVSDATSAASNAAANATEEAGAAAEEAQAAVPDSPVPHHAPIPHAPDHAHLDEMPDAPEAPEMPDVPEMPAPDAPEVPDVPELPETPDVPGAPDTPDMPSGGPSGPPGGPGPGRGPR